MSTANGKGLVLFDIDGVLADFDMQMQEWRRARGLPPDRGTYYSPNDRGWATLHDRFAEHGFFLSTPVHADTLEVMHELTRRGYTTGCFTARQSFTGQDTLDDMIREHTKDWLRAIRVPDPQRLHFCGRDLKCELIVGLEAIAMVEDHLETAVDIAQLHGVHGEPIQSFLLDREWNRHDKYQGRIHNIRDMLAHLP